MRHQLQLCSWLSVTTRVILSLLLLLIYKSVQANNSQRSCATGYYWFEREKKHILVVTLNSNEQRWMYASTICTCTHTRCWCVCGKFTLVACHEYSASGAPFLPACHKKLFMGMDSILVACQSLVSLHYSTGKWFFHRLFYCKRMQWINHLLRSLEKLYWIRFERFQYTTWTKGSNLFSIYYSKKY